MQKKQPDDTKCNMINELNLKNWNGGTNIVITTNMQNIMQTQ